MEWSVLFFFAFLWIATIKTIGTYAERVAMIMWLGKKISSEQLKREMQVGTFPGYQQQ